MPARKERYDLEKVTIKLFSGEFKKLSLLYPKAGANRVIREMVHRHLKVIEETAQRDLGQLPRVDVDLGDLT